VHKYNEKDKERFSMNNHLKDVYCSIKNGLTPIHADGYKFIAIAGIATFLAFFYSCTVFWFCVVLTLYVCYFFRDPERVTPVGEGLVISPADGLVQKIVEIVPPAELELGAEPLTRISIFLNVFDVHVNRIPIGGKVVVDHYVAGKFMNAELDKASDENERQLITLENGRGRFGLVQIAGLVARRILCQLEKGQQVETGERYGLIRFGSRVDVYLPKTAQIKVLEGQRSIGGETILAEV
jgi:phosphatidylserine decarboxylase